MKVYVMNISAGIGNVPDSIAEQLKNETENIKNQKRKNEIIAGRLLLYKAFEDMGFDTIPGIKTGESGKPFAENAPHFNISHDGDFVLCACGDTEVGADIVKTERFCGKEPNRIFTEKEKMLVENKVVKSALLWSLKEAYVKMTGEGLKGVSDAPDFSVLLAGEDFPNGEKCGKGWFYSREMSGYIITVCTKEPREISLVFC